MDEDSPGKGRMAKVARTAAGQALVPPSAASAYLSTCHQATRLFGRIRESVACQAAPSTLQAVFLEPVAGQLAAELSVEMFGRADDDFMALFTGAQGLGGCVWGGGGWEWRAVAGRHCAAMQHPCHRPARPAAAGVMSALEAGRDALAKRVEGLVKCKQEFESLARCL